MAATMLGSLLVSLGLDSAQFKSGLSTAEKELRKSIKRIEAEGAKVARIGRNLTLGITVPLAAIGAAAFKTASDVAELEGAFDATFGNMSKAMRDWAVETGDTLGRSTQEIQASLVSFQELFSKAFDPGKAAEMSKTFAVLTQDLASFKNLSNEVAQQKLFSGLVGEAEPLRAVGVLLSENAVKAKAAQLGLAGVKGELSEQAKVAARAALILEQLSTAQGDVVRTSDSTENQIKRARAAFQELQVAIGTKLLPVLTPLISRLTDLLTVFTKLPSSIQTSLIGIGLFAGALGPVISILARVVTGLRTFMAVAKSAAVTATAAGAATTTFSAAMGILRTRLIAAVATLGPYALALTAIGGLLYLLTMRSQQATNAQEAYNQALATAEQSAKDAKTASERLATAMGAERKAALEAAQAQRALTQARLQAAQARLLQAEFEAKAAAAEAKRTAALASGGGPGEGVPGRISSSQQRFNAARREAERTGANAKAAEQTVLTLMRARDELDQQIKAAMAPANIPTVAPVTTGGGSSGRKSSADRAREEKEELERAKRVAAQVQDEIDAYNADILRTRADLTRSAEDRAIAELAALKADRASYDRQLFLDKELDVEQRASLMSARDAADSERRRAILIEASEELAQERLDRETAANALEQEVVSARGSIQDRTAAQRRVTALRLVDLEFSQREAEAMQAYNDATRRGDQVAADIARSKLARIQLLKELAQQEAELRNQSPLQAYLDEITLSSAEVSEALENIAANGLRSLSDGLTDAILGFKSLGDVAKNILAQITSALVKMAINKMIMSVISGGITGGLGIPGFARGTNFAPGGLAIVGERGPELVNLPRGSQVVPNHELNNMRGGSQIFQPTFVFPGVRNGADAREAGAQAARAFRQKINGPVRV